MTLHNPILSMCARARAHNRFTESLTQPYTPYTNAVSGSQNRQGKRLTMPLSSPAVERLGNYTHITVLKDTRSRLNAFQARFGIRSYHRAVITLLDLADTLDRRGLLGQFMDLRVPSPAGRASAPTGEARDKHADIQVAPEME